MNPIPITALIACCLLLAFFHPTPEPAPPWVDLIRLLAMLVVIAAAMALGVQLMVRP